jgi:hypothetical protein
MTFFRNIIEQIFPRPEAIASGEETIDRGPISRSPSFINKYQSFRQSERWIWMKSILSTAFQASILHPGKPTGIGLYKGNGIQGLVIDNTLEASREEYQYLLEYLKDTTSSLNYMFYHGVSESREKDGRIQIKEEYYLKPRPVSMKLPAAQEYGNITLQLNMVNDSVESLKIMVTTYSGFNYQEPKSFEELISHYFPAN